MQKPGGRALCFRRSSISPQQCGCVRRRAWRHELDEARLDSQNRPILSGTLNSPQNCRWLVAGVDFVLVFVLVLQLRRSRMISPFRPPRLVSRDQSIETPEQIKLDCSDPPCSSKRWCWEVAQGQESEVRGQWIRVGVLRQRL